MKLSNTHESRAANGENGATLSDSRAVTRRAIALGALLTIPNTFWITVVEVRWYTLDGTSLPLFITPIFFLFWIKLANMALQKRFPNRPRLPLTQAEMLTIYVFLMMGTLLAGHDMFQNLFGSIAHADRFATPENNWKSLFFAFLPSFWLMRDPVAQSGFYQGSVSPYSPQHWLPFVAPLFWWTLFMGTLIAICFCFNILIHKRWADEERLSFPIIQLPVALSSETVPGLGGGLLSDKRLWLGFALVGVIDLVNGLHYLYPSLPYIEIVKLYNVGQFFTARPWSAVSSLNIALYPFAIGLAYFVPLDLLFSCWFFFLARTAFHVFGAAAGMDGQGSAGFPYFPQQASGAWIALGLTIVWALRGQVQTAWRSAFDTTPCDREELGERRRRRGAFFGLGLGLLSLAGFSYAIGLSPFIAFLFFGCYFLLAVTITRVRAELGTPHEIYFVNPRLILVTLFGSQALGAQNLTAMSSMYWFNRGYRCHPMPNQIEALQIGRTARMHSASVIGMIVLALVWGTAVAYWANLHVTFSAGATGKALGFKQWVGAESYGQLQTWLQTPARANPVQLLYTAIGFLITLFLRVMRGNFLWWPFHPAGYALATSFALDYFWLCFFVAWFAKFMIIRFGGMKGHNAAVPFFLGLTLGDYVIGSLWALYGPMNQLQTYKIFV